MRSSSLDIGETSQHWIDMIKEGNFSFFYKKINYYPAPFILIYKNLFFGPMLVMQAQCNSYYVSAYYKSWLFGRKVKVDSSRFTKELRSLIEAEYNSYYLRKEEEKALNSSIHKRFGKKS